MVVLLEHRKLIISKQSMPMRCKKWLGCLNFVGSGMFCCLRLSHLVNFNGLLLKELWNNPTFITSLRSSMVIYAQGNEYTNNTKTNSAEFEFSSSERIAWSLGWKFQCIWILSCGLNGIALLLLLCCGAQQWIMMWLRKSPCFATHILQLYYIERCKKMLLFR